VALLTFALVALVVFLLALPDIRVQQISGPTIAALCRRPGGARRGDRVGVFPR
jgi:hypothetical protein